MHFYNLGGVNDAVFISRDGMIYKMCFYLSFITKYFKFGTLMAGSPGKPSSATMTPVSHLAPRHRMLISTLLCSALLACGGGGESGSDSESLESAAGRLALKLPRSPAEPSVAPALVAAPTVNAAGDFGFTADCVAETNRKT